MQKKHYPYDNLTPLFSDRRIDPQAVNQRVIKVVLFYQETFKLAEDETGTKLGFSKTQIHGIVAGKRIIPTSLVQLSYMTGISTDYFLYGENPESLKTFMNRTLDRLIENAETYRSEILRKIEQDNQPAQPIQL